MGTMECDRDYFFQPNVNPHFALFFGYETSYLRHQALGSPCKRRFSELCLRSQSISTSAKSQKNMEKLVISKGAELEFATVGILPGFKDPHGDDNRTIQKCTANFVNNRGVDRGLFYRFWDIEVKEVLDHLQTVKKDARSVEKEHPSNPTGVNRKPDAAEIAKGEILGPLGKDQIYETYRQYAVVKDLSSDWYQNPGEPNAWRTAPSGPPGYVFFGVEMKTNVYENTDDLEADLEKISSAITSNKRVCVNRGQGSSRPSTHVHLGLSEKMDVCTKLPFLQKLLSLMILVEPVIMSIHASWAKDFTRYSSLLRSHTVLTRECFPEDVRKLGIRDDAAPTPWDHPRRDEINFKLRKGQVAAMNQFIPDGVLASRESTYMAKIWAATDLSELVWLSSSVYQNRRPALNVYNLLEGDEDEFSAPSAQNFRIRKTPIGTIEFRHMQGSLDGRHIAHWVRITEQLVRISYTYDKKDFQNLVTMISEASGKDVEALTFQQFGDIIGLTTDTINYFTNIKPPAEVQREAEAPTDAQGWKDMFLLPKSTA